MRKVNLRNVDPAIDDPDASTWCELIGVVERDIICDDLICLAHPTLNRHSPPEVVANFKRRVPPRLPKPRKRDAQEQPTIPPPRPPIGMGPIPLTVPSVGPPSHHHHKLSPAIQPVGRARGFSAPGSFNPLAQQTAGWGPTAYPRAALPPLTVPSDPPHLSHSTIYSHSPHTLHPIASATDDSSASAGFNSMSSYSTSGRDMLVSSSQYGYSEQNNWPSFSHNTTGSSSHNGSLSSLLNPSTNGYSRPTPTINTSYASPFSSIPMQEHSASSMSPDSRPTTGYSMSSVSSLPYQDEHLHDYSRPNSSHRPISPPRPQSSKSTYASTTFSVRRARRHSQAMSPYPSPYDHTDQQRPSSSPQPVDDHQPNGIPRVRSMIQLPSVDTYSFNSSQPDFAYSSIPGAVSHATGMDTMNDSNSWSHRNLRPSTSTSSISAASHTSSSQANTPPIPDNYGANTDINRCESWMPAL